MKLYKFNSFKKHTKRKYVKHNFGVQAMIDAHKITPFQTSMYNEKVFKEMKDGYYDSQKIDEFEEMVTLNRYIEKGRDHVTISEFNYDYNYNLMDFDFLDDVHVMVKMADSNSSDYHFIRSKNQKIFSYGTSLKCKLLL